MSDVGNSGLNRDGTDRGGHQEDGPGASANRDHFERANARWGMWLASAMGRRKPSFLAEATVSRGITEAVVISWLGGRSRATFLEAIDVANALELPPSRALHAAGFASTGAPLRPRILVRDHPGGVIAMEMRFPDRRELDGFDRLYLGSREIEGRS